jgi:hypothetical protein
MVDRPAEAKPEGRLAERALVLTVATLILLTPPILTIFDVPVTIAGIPLLHVYCFAIWLIAIALGGWLATRMQASRANPDPKVPTAADKA